jgi:hypothetical protein
MRAANLLVILLCLLPGGATAFHQEPTQETRVCPEREGTIETTIPHGSIGDVFEIHRSGPPQERYDIVLIPEGYSAEEQDIFEDQAMQFGRALLDRPTFGRCADNFNIWGVHVISDQSGIDFPCLEHFPLPDGSASSLPCIVDGQTCPGNADHLVDTFFNSTHCHKRSPTGAPLDKDLVGIVANQAVGCGLWETAIVFINYHQTPAGQNTGGEHPIAWVWGGDEDYEFMNTQIHELGHSFSLWEEYCSDESFPELGAGEPSYRNVTHETDPTLIKWKDLIGQNVPIPTTGYPECLECTPSLAPGACEAASPQCVVEDCKPRCLVGTELEAPCAMESPDHLCVSDSTGCVECDPPSAQLCPTGCVARECHPGCMDLLADDPCQSEPPERPSWCVPDDWTVGLYSGAAGGRCGAFRPAFFLRSPSLSPEPTACIMDSNSPAHRSLFCPVCSRAITQELGAYNHLADRFEPNGTPYRPEHDCQSQIPSLVHDLGGLEDLPGVFQRHFHPEILDTSSSRFGCDEESWAVTLDDLSLHSPLDNDWLRISLPEHPSLPTECGSLTIPTTDITGASVEDLVSFTGAATVSIGRSRDLPGEAVRIDRFPMEGQDAFTKTIRCPFDAESDFSTLNIRVGREEWLTGDTCVPDARPCACGSCADYRLSVSYAIDIIRARGVSDRLRHLLELERSSSLPCPDGGFFPHCQRVEGEPLIFTHPPVPQPGECGPADGCPFYYLFVWEGTAPFELMLSSDVDLSFELLDLNLAVIAEALPIDIHGATGPLEVLASVTDGDGHITKRLAAPDLPAGVYVLLVTGTEATFSMDFEPPPPAADADGDGVPDPFDPCPIDAEDLDGTRDGDGCPDPVIDVKPGQPENPVNLRGRGVIPVALLGDAAFDVSELDVSTLRFGRCGATEASPAHDLSDPRVLANHLEDVNGDGYVDLVSHYRQEDAKFVADDDEACLVVNKTDGAPLLGIDSVRVLF